MVALSPLTALESEVWQHVSVNVNAAAHASLFVNGELAGEGQVVLPTENLRTDNYLARSSRSVDRVLEDSRFESIGVAKGLAL